MMTMTSSAIMTRCTIVIMDVIVASRQDDRLLNHIVLSFRVNMVMTVL